MSGVSVFVPSYNYGRYLPDSVESVLDQSDVDVRVLIIDDASSDETPEVAAELQARDPRVQYVRHRRNLGHIATYNEGLEWADGDYTVLLSADDMLTPGALGRAVELMDAHPEAGLVYGGVVRFQSGQPLPPARTPLRSRRWRIVDGRRWIAAVCRLGGNPTHAPEFLVRTELQRQIGGYRPHLPHSGDMEMWLRFAAIGHVGRILDSDQAYYRVHDHNMRQRYSASTVNLQQVAAAFDTLVTADCERLPNASRLHRIARLRVARRAIRMACQALDAGQTEWEGESVESLIQQARALSPDIEGRPEWLALQWRLFLGPRWAHAVKPVVGAVTLRHPRAWTRYRLRSFRAC
jgi:hypothetical protein